MAETNARKRPIGFNETSTVETDDFLLIDGATSGTRKIKPDKVGKTSTSEMTNDAGFQNATEVAAAISANIDANLETQGKAADAKAVGDALDGKVDKSSGQGLSDNNYTTAEKTKLAGVATGATRVLIDTGLSDAGKAADAGAVGTALAGKVGDVKVAGSSVVSDGEAVIPLAGENTPGVVRVDDSYGNRIDENGILKTYAASESVIKAGSNSYRPIASNHIHEAAFYGLAKAAGDTTQAASSNAVGNYTDDAKEAIQDMLGVSDEIAGLKSDLSQIWSDQIVAMEETGETSVSSNLFKYAELVGEGKTISFVSGVTGKAVLADNTDYNTYLIPVDGESTYTFTNYRCAVAVSDKEYTAVGSLLTYGTTISSTGGTYILFCFKPTEYPISTYSITKPVNDYYIPNNWNLSKSIINTAQIDGMLPTGKTVESNNLFSKATLVAAGKYVDRITNGKAVLADNSSYNTYIISVDGESIYTFTDCRTAVLVSDLEYTAVSSLLSNVTNISTTGGAFVLFSFNPTTYPVASYKITKPTPEYRIPNDWNISKNTKTGYQRNSGSIASGGTLALTGKTAIKYGYQIIFKSFISAFNEIKLAFYNYNNSVISNAINVTSSDLVIYVGTTAVATLPHGLTIANYISLVVDYQSDGVKITLYSNGGSFTTTTTFERLTSGVVSPTIISTGTVCTNAVLELTVSRAKKPVWYFGDSYISYTNLARWAYYLVENEFDNNTLLNGYAGGTSATSVMALQALLEYGTPKFAVFATGMNDGSDSTTAPSTSWVNARNNFIQLCEKNGIEIVFCTVPTVPSVNNEQKNAWVKSSGYRYIDFAKAVGADSNGIWYSGMLSTDNVHPTEQGAIALFTQAISDLPEFIS